MREDIALMGEDIRTAIDDQAMKTWGEQPAVRFFPGARWVALALACAVVLTFGLFLAQVLSLRPFLAVVLAELIFGLVVRDAVRRVAVLVSTPARELKLVRLLLERLEKEAFTAPRLVEPDARAGRARADGFRGNPATGTSRGISGLGAQSVFSSVRRAANLDPAVHNGD